MGEENLPDYLGGTCKVRYNAAPLGCPDVATVGKRLQLSEKAINRQVAWIGEITDWDTLVYVDQHWLVYHYFLESGQCTDQQCIRDRESGNIKGKVIVGDEAVALRQDTTPSIESR